MKINLIVIAAALAVEVALWFIYRLHLGRYNLIRNTETSRITTLKKGFYEIKGKVKFLEEKLTSPYSRIPCVYYHFKVEEERGDGKHSHWYSLIDDRKSVQFAVEDPSGMAYINLDGAKLKLSTDAKGGTGLFTETSPKLEKTMALYHQTSKGWIFKRKLRFSEKYITENDALYVLGEVQDFKSYYPVFSKGKLPFLVSDQSEEKLLKTAKRIVQVVLFFLLAVPAGVILFLLFRSSWV